MEQAQKEEQHVEIENVVASRSHAELQAAEARAEKEELRKLIQRLRTKFDKLVLRVDADVCHKHVQLTFMIVVPPGDVAASRADEHETGVVGNATRESSTSGTSVSMHVQQLFCSCAYRTHNDSCQNANIAKANSGSVGDGGDVTSFSVAATSQTAD